MPLLSQILTAAAPVFLLAAGLTLLTGTTRAINGHGYAATLGILLIVQDAMASLELTIPANAIIVALAIVLMAATLIIRPHGLLRSELPTPALIRPTPLSARLLFAAALLLAIAAPFLVAPATLSRLIAAPIAILFAASFHFLIGPGGIPSLGHAAFFGIGAYATAFLARDAQFDLRLALLAAPVAAGAAALVLGALVVRLPPLYVAMLTLLFAQILWTLAAHVPALAIISPPWATPALLYGVALALCIGVTLLLRRALDAPFGYAFRATRDDPVRAAAIGLPAYRLRLSAFTIAGATAGLAGALTALETGIVSSADLSLTKSAEAALMVLLGGLQTVSGPIVGALAITALHDAVQHVTTAWRLCLGLTLITVALVFPQGIAGASIRFWRRAA